MQTALPSPPPLSPVRAADAAAPPPAEEEEEAPGVPLPPPPPPPARLPIALSAAIIASCAPASPPELPAPPCRIYSTNAAFSLQFHLGTPAASHAASAALCRLVWGPLKWMAL